MVKWYCHQHGVQEWHLQQIGKHGVDLAAWDDICKVTKACGPAWTLKLCPTLYQPHCYIGQLQTALNPDSRLEAKRATRKCTSGKTYVLSQPTVELSARAKGNRFQLHRGD